MASKYIFEIKPNEIWREIWIQVLLQLYLWAIFPSLFFLYYKKLWDSVIFCIKFFFFECTRMFYSLFRGINLFLFLWFFSILFLFLWFFSILFFFHYLHVRSFANSYFEWNYKLLREIQLFVCIEAKVKHWWCPIFHCAIRKHCNCVQNLLLLLS